MRTKVGSNKRKPRLEITAVDRRDPRRLVISKHQVARVLETEDSIFFLADWRFPVPASRRRFFVEMRELAVEECGKVPGKNMFQFSGIFIRRIAI